MRLAIRKEMVVFLIAWVVVIIVVVIAVVLIVLLGFFSRYGSR